MFSGVKAEISESRCVVSEKNRHTISLCECQYSTTAVWSRWLVLWLVFWFQRSVDIPPRTGPVVCRLSVCSGVAVWLTFGRVKSSGSVVGGSCFSPCRPAMPLPFSLSDAGGTGPPKVSVYIPLLNWGQRAVDNSEEILTWHLGL